jgi:predicted ATPase/DNA-binding winged helix-turn-helix (wHTH) protein
MVSETNANLVYACDQWEIDLGRRELRSRGIPVPLGGRAFEIIKVLVQTTGLVTRDRMMEQVWPGVFVSESTIRVHIFAVRKALGQDRAMLKTVPGRGYRLLGTWNMSRGTRPVGGAQSGAAAAPSLPVLSNNLPPAGTNLIGRALNVQELQDLLSAYRGITLTGPGGIGKSKLALETARHMLAQGHGDVWFVELASLSNPDLVASTVANALGLGLGFVDVSSEIVASAIGQRKILLLLDNCEHIIDAAALFAEAIMRRCAHATILATSREVLRIDGEYVYRVLPLDVPDRRGTPGNILKSSAVQLFVARTTAMNSGFVPDETNLFDVVGICQHLDGIPLAIEFAAARAAVLGVSEVASRLEDRFSLLTAGRRTALARHQTLRAALDWSYDLLTASEQRLLCHLSIFLAGFTLEAAAAVVRDTGHETTVIGGIANLVGKSLLMLDASASGGRWRLLETIRAYALEKLQESGEAASAQRRHAEYFHGLLTPAGLVSTWEPAPEAVTRYAQEIDNVRAALDWCFSPAGNLSIGIAITAAFLPVWLHSAFLAECRKRAETALAHLGDDPNGDASLRMQLQISRGITLNHTGARTDEALAMLTEGFRTAEALGDTLSQMYALWGLWVSLGYKGNYRATEPVAEKFFRLAVASGDPARGYLADRLMGTSLRYRGDQPKARVHLDRVAEQYRRSLERPQAAWWGYNLSDFAQSSLAHVLCLQGFLDQAHNLAQTCVDRTQLTGQKIAVCHALAEAACPIALTVKDLDAAEKHVTLLVNAATALDLAYWKTLTRCFEGMLLINQGNYHAGVTTLRDALAVCDEVGGMSRYPAFLGAMADGLSGLGRTDEARITLDQALVRANRDGEEWCIPDLLCKKGVLALQEAGPSSVLSATATRCFLDALALAQKQGALFWELRSALLLARLLLDREHLGDARQILAPVFGQFVEGFETAELRAAKLLLDSIPPEGTKRFRSGRRRNGSQSAC